MRMYKIYYIPTQYTYYYRSAEVSKVTLKYRKYNRKIESMIFYKLISLDLIKLYGNISIEKLTYFNLE